MHSLLKNKVPHIRTLIVLGLGLIISAHTLVPHHHFDVHHLAQDFCCTHFNEAQSHEESKSHCLSFNAWVAQQSAFQTLKSPADQIPVAFLPASQLALPSVKTFITSFRCDGIPPFPEIFFTCHSLRGPPVS